MWYQNIGSMFFCSSHSSLVTDGQNYDLQYRASIAASRGKNKTFLNAAMDCTNVDDNNRNRLCLMQVKLRWIQCRFALVSSKCIRVGLSFLWDAIYIYISFSTLPDMVYSGFFVRFSHSSNSRCAIPRISSAVSINNIRSIRTQHHYLCSDTCQQFPSRHCISATEWYRHQQRCNDYIYLHQVLIVISNKSFSVVRRFIAKWQWLYYYWNKISRWLSL